MQNTIVTQLKKQKLKEKAKEKGFMLFTEKCM